MSSLTLALSLAAAFGLASAHAGTSPAAAPQASSSPGNAADWLTGENVSLGGVLFPHVHFLSVFGDSSGDAAALSAGHHDPHNDGWTVQGFEFGSSLRAGWLQGFTTYHLGYDRNTDEWSGEFEEWFGKIVNLPGGFELRGGKFYNRFGLQNATHLHGWDWADQYLVVGRFLGDDGLTSIGGEVNWTLPVSWTSLLTASVGKVPSLDHEHDHEEANSAFHAEEMAFADVITTANWTNQFEINDFHQFRAGVSGAWGDNGWGKTSQVYGAHLEYQWRENGLEPGGQFFRWRTEVMLRSIDALNELTSRSATLHESGVYTDLRYGFNEHIEAGLRAEYVSGIRDAGLDERFRLSPGVTYFLNNKRTMLLRVQYNYDHSDTSGDDHGIWAQIGFNWGGAEVR